MRRTTANSPTTSRTVSAIYHPVRLSIPSVASAIRDCWQRSACSTVGFATSQGVQRQPGAPCEWVASYNVPQHACNTRSGAVPAVGCRVRPPLSTSPTFRDVPQHWHGRGGAWQQVRRSGVVSHCRLSPSGLTVPVRCASLPRFFPIKANAALAQGWPQREAIMARCKAKNAKGVLCGAPESLVDERTGLCPSHVEGAHERLSAIGRKGAEASAARFRRSGLDASDLGSLETVRDAQRWLEAIGEGVVTGRLKPQEATAGVRAVETWLKAESERLKVEDLEQLRTQGFGAKPSEIRVNEYPVGWQCRPNHYGVVRGQSSGSSSNVYSTNATTSRAYPSTGSTTDDRPTRRVVHFGTEAWTGV